ncbi:MAG TPA: CDP-alcohol phosphatidyltransferase family protein [Vicinamibacteria bacterium]|nr:CDP-alcohol phosphatidyltransferase family protein [Vicinamibacteria bacterium]
MVSIYALKPAFQGLLRPLTRGLAGAGVTANSVTVLAAVLSLLVGTAIAISRGARGALLLLPAALFARMALNAIDGMLAREHGQKSRLGALLNEIGDVVSDAALYLPLALVPGFDPRLAVGIVVLAAVSEMTGVLGPTIGASRRYDGPMGKSDRAFVFGLLALLLGLGLRPGAWLVVAQGGVFVLLLVTVWNRAAHALREGRQ